MEERGVKCNDMKGRVMEQESSEVDEDRLEEGIALAINRPALHYGA
jgi:hypothetical protein